jgi:hypothetical protein
MFSTRVFARQTGRSFSTATVSTEAMIENKVIDFAGKQKGLLGLWGWVPGGVQTVE